MICHMKEKNQADIAEIRKSVAQLIFQLRITFLSFDNLHCVEVSKYINDNYHGTLKEFENFKFFNGMFATSEFLFVLNH